MPSVGWLRDGSEESLRSALALVVPELAARPLRIKPRHPSSNQLWWSASAVIDECFVVKYAWSRLRAMRLWREGVLLQRLCTHDPSLAIPELVAVSAEPALVVTRLVAGAPLSWEWASSLTRSGIDQVGQRLAAFLVRLHNIPAADLVGDLPVVLPTPQADTERLRERFPRLVDERRRALVLRWCEWVDEVLCGPVGLPSVVVHGDLHGDNQVWDQASFTLLAVVDFEESGIADPHFDLRYLPGSARTTKLALEVLSAYERLCGRRLAIERMMAWHVLTGRLGPVPGRPPGNGTGHRVWPRCVRRGWPRSAPRSTPSHRLTPATSCPGSDPTPGSSPPSSPSSDRQSGSSIWRWAARAATASGKTLRTR